MTPTNNTLLLIATLAVFATGIGGLFHRHNTLNTHWRNQTHRFAQHVSHKTQGRQRSHKKRLNDCRRRFTQCHFKNDKWQITHQNAKDIPVILNWVSQDSSIRTLTLHNQKGLIHVKASH